MKFIELTSVYKDESIYLRVDEILSMWVDASGATKIVTHGHTCRVNESPTDVFEIMKTAESGIHVFVKSADECPSPAVKTLQKALETLTVISDALDNARETISDGIAQ